MWQDPPEGKQCTQILDLHGRHAACCTKGLHTRRHDRIRDLLAKLAWQAGLTATTQQAVLISDQIMPDGQPAPGSVRPIHRADVHIIEPAGSELCLDVKIHTVAPDIAIAKELLREELTKCRAYGQQDGCNLQALEKGMTPIVLEQYGRTAPEAQTIFNRIIHHCLQFLIRQGLPFSHAKRVASSELWGPISGTLLRAAWQAHAECTPRIGPADLGDTPPNVPDSLGRHSDCAGGLPSRWLERFERFDRPFAKRSPRQLCDNFATLCHNFSDTLRQLCALRHFETLRFATCCDDFATTLRQLLDTLLAIPLAWYRIGFGPPARNRKK